MMAKATVRSPVVSETQNAALQSSSAAFA